MSSEKYKESGYPLRLNLLIILHYSRISYPREVDAELVASFFRLAYLTVLTTCSIVLISQWLTYLLWMQGEPYSNGSGLASQTASGVLTASGHPNTRLGSTTSSGVLTRMQSALNPEEAREYITKVSNLLFEFSRGDSVVKMHMCSLSLLIRLFQMLNKLETPILLKVWQNSTMRCWFI